MTETAIAVDRRRLRKHRWPEESVSDAVHGDEVETTPIRTTLVNPGPMRTKMRAAAFPGEDPDTLTPPEAIAPLIVELARGDAQPPAEVDFKVWAEAG